MATVYSFKDMDQVDKQLEEFSEKINGVYTCKICLKTFASRTNNHYHIETHMDGLLFSCDKCDRTTKTRNALKKHYGFYHKFAPFQVGQMSMWYVDRTTTVKCIKIFQFEEKIYLLAPPTNCIVSGPAQVPTLCTTLQPSEMSRVWSHFPALAGLGWAGLGWAGWAGLVPSHRDKKLTKREMLCPLLPCPRSAPADTSGQLKQVVWAVH